MYSLYADDLARTMDLSWSPDPELGGKVPQMSLPFIHLWL